MDYLDRLARLAATTRLDALSASAVEAARRVLLDTLGAIAAGSGQPENRRLAELAAARTPQGGATLIGHRLRADAFWAALANATAGVALEVDEGNRHGGGHPAIHTLPGALAATEERGLGGARLLESLVVGYEIGSRLGGATTPRANVHSHGTWGAISTAVAAARLDDAGAETMRAVINLAASMSPANSWTPALEGATVRNLYPGRSAFQGLLAAEAHRCGFTALADGPADVYGTILAERFDPALAVAGLDGVDIPARWRIEENYFKRHACCRYNHYALDAVLALRDAHGLAADDVVRVDVTTIPFGARMTTAAPATLLGAKFSIPYAVAAALVLGRADTAAFEATVRADARVRDLAQRVAVQTDPAMSPRRADYPTARVRIALRDGRVLHAETTVPRGDADNPVSGRDVEDKFQALAAPVLGDTRAREVVAAVREVEALKDVRALTALLGPA